MFKRCQACELGEHYRCTRDTTLGTQGYCACYCDKARENPNRPRFYLPPSLAKEAYFITVVVDEDDDQVRQANTSTSRAEALAFALERWRTKVYRMVAVVSKPGGFMVAHYGDPLPGYGDDPLPRSPEFPDDHDLIEAAEGLVAEALRASLPAVDLRMAAGVFATAARRNEAGDAGRCSVFSFLSRAYARAAGPPAS